MALNDVIRSAVATVNSVTASLQPVVRHSTWVRQDISGRPTYGRPVQGLDIFGYDPTSVSIAYLRPAIVDLRQSSRIVNGTSVVTSAHIVFLEPLTDEPSTRPGLVAPSSPRVGPIDPRDIFVLPDGRFGPYIDAVSPPIDPLTNQPYFYEVWLGPLSERGALI